MSDEVHLFLAGLAPPPVLDARAVAEVEAAVTGQLAAARAEWPEITGIDGLALALFAERVGGSAEPATPGPVTGAGLVAAITALPAADLYIAAACAAGNPAALRAFEARHFAGLAAALRRVDADPTFVAEVAQIVREKLFVATPGRPARIRDLAGQGDLGGLVRVVALRTGLNLRRAEHRLELHDDHSMLGALVPQGSPELAVLRDEHRGLIKDAFAAALAGLEPRERNLLRMHLVHGLGIDEIGSAYDVHRSTAARWLERIRDELRRATVRILREKLGVSPDELASLIGAVDSRIELSLDRLLGGSVAAGPTRS